MEIMTAEYRSWLQELKERIQTSQIRAAIKIGRWVLFYTHKCLIVSPPVTQLENRSQPDNSQQFENASDQIVQILFRIPWKHHREIIRRCSNYDEAIFYVIEAGKFNWSCNVLINQIESNLWQRKGKAITNFELTLPVAQSDLARELIKDPYAFDYYPARLFTCCPQPI